MTNITLENLGTVNKNKVTIYSEVTGLAFVRLYFSYETIVAFWYQGELVVIKNQWSTITGKLLNELQPNKSKRVEPDEFKKQLNKILKRLIID